MFEKFFVYLTELSGGLAYWIIFGVLVACGLGFPLPEDIPLIASGYLIWDGTMEWPETLAVTMTGVLVGDSILFFLGRKLGTRFRQKRGALQTTKTKRGPIFPPEKVRRVRAYFRKYGGKVVFFARFLAGFRAVAFFLAGSLGVSYQKFLLLDGLAAILSVPIWIALGYGLGYSFGDELSAIMHSMKNFKNYFSIGLFSIVALILIKTIYQWQKIKNAKKKSL